MKIYFSLIFVTFLLISCSTEKIPVTTSSEKALDFYYQGLDLAERLRRPDAIEYFNKAIALDTNFVLAYLNRGFVTRSSSESLSDFNKAIQKKEMVSHAEKLWINAVEEQINGFPKKAEDNFRQLAGEYPQDERAQNMLGNFLFSQQEYENAIEYYLKAIEINPDFSQPYNQLGYCYRYLGNYVKAEEAFKKYISMIPDDPNPYDSYAELLLKMGEFEVSIEMYEKALEIDPNFIFSYTGMATNLMLKHEHEEARKILMDLFRTAKEEGDRRLALISIAITFVDEEQPDKALSVLEKTYRLAEQQNNMTDMANSRAIMGNILLETGRIDEAIKYYNEARRLIETSELSSDIKTAVEQNYLYTTTRIQIAKKNLDAAEETLTEYKSRATKTEHSQQLRAAHQLAGMIAYERKQYNEAIEQYNQANQQNPYLLYRIGEAYLAKGEKEEAARYFNRAAEFNQLNSLEYAFIRKKAERKAVKLRSEIS